MSVEEKKKKDLENWINFLIHLHTGITQTNIRIPALYIFLEATMAVLHYLPKLFAKNKGF